jgi:RNA polymerase sigma-70 factor (ECF subfamily)
LSLAVTFLDSWSGAAQYPHDARRALDDALDVALAAARAAWPALTLDARRYVTHLAARIDGAGDPAAALAALHVEDLYLACACLEHDAAALQAFERAHADDTRVVLRVDASPAFVDEVRQQLRLHLFVRESPKAAEYSGRGALSAWLRVVALRVAQMCKRAQLRDPAPPASDDDAGDRELMGDDPELDHIKQLYQHEFNDAVAQAVRALPPRDRTVLRLHTLERLNIEKIGTIYGVHRATVAAWIAAARRAILDDTRRRLGEQLQLEGSDLDSLIGLVRSRLDLRLSQLLDENAR